MLPRERWKPLALIRVLLGVCGSWHTAGAAMLRYTDGDGIADVVEKTVDTDGDGLPA